MPSSNEDVFHQVHQMPLAMSLTVPKLYPSLACLSGISPHIFQVRWKQERNSKLPQNSDWTTKWYYSDINGYIVTEYVLCTTKSQANQDKEILLWFVIGTTHIYSAWCEPMIK